MLPNDSVSMSVGHLVFGSGRHLYWCLPDSKTRCPTDIEMFSLDNNTLGSKKFLNY